MREVAPSVDYVSMDWKLESDVRWADAEPSKARPSSFEDGHVAFLDLLVAQGVAACVKVVVTRETTKSELEKVCHALMKVAPPTPLILQPVTPFGRVRESPSAESLLGHLRTCEGSVQEVRLIPQTHRAYGAL